MFRSHLNQQISYLSRMQIIMIPEINSMTNRIKRKTPQFVKSHFVWNAKKVNANVAPVQIPTAISTDSGSYRTAQHPSDTPSAAMNENIILIILHSFLVIKGLVVNWRNRSDNLTCKYAQKYVICRGFSSDVRDAR